MYSKCTETLAGDQLFCVLLRWTDQYNSNFTLSINNVILGKYKHDVFVIQTINNCITDFWVYTYTYIHQIDNLSSVFIIQLYRID